MATEQKKSGGGLFSKLVVIALFAVAVGLYLRIVMVDGQPESMAAYQQASVQVLEGNEPMPANRATPLQDLPADQMALIKQVFAPKQTL